MKKLLTLAAGLAAGLSLIVTPAGAVTGNFVEDFEHPYVGLVAFYDAEGNFLHRCSGALLTDQVFLTAGHCTDQGHADAPVLARIWFHQNVGGAFNPPTVPEDPNTGYPNRCLPGDPLCVESTLLFDMGFDNFAGFPNTRDAGLILLRTPVTGISEYGVLARPGFLDSLATRRGRQEVTFTVTGYGVSLTNPTRTVSFRERLMAQTKLVNINSALNGGFNLQLSSAPAHERGGLCFGDSGGPVLYGEFSSNLIVGINSFVLNQNCRGVGFAFRTDTEAVINWILETVRQHLGAAEANQIQFAG
jgi:hypothetical protein